MIEGVLTGTFYRVMIAAGLLLRSCVFVLWPGFGWLNLA